MDMIAIPSVSQVTQPQLFLSQQKKEGKDAYITGVPVSLLSSDEDRRIWNRGILVFHLFILNLVLCLGNKDKRDRQT